jgi:hypothetical protein
MTDMQSHLAKIRSDAAECLLLGSLVPDDKRSMFVKISEHLNTLAFEIERTIALNGSTPIAVAPQPEEVVRQPIAADHEVAGSELAVSPKPEVRRSHRIIPWLLAMVVGTGAFFWITPHVENYSALITAPLKNEPPPAPQEDTKQTTAAPASVDQHDRVLREQMGMLLTRVDNIQKALDNLKISEAVEGSNRQSAGSLQQSDNSALPAPDAAARKEGNGLSGSSAPTGPVTLSSPDTAKPAVLPPTTLPSTSNPHEEFDRVGSITSPEAEIDQRRAAGPVGCMRFRSFDPISGTYWTFDGRRRPCR